MANLRGTRGIMAPRNPPKNQGVAYSPLLSEIMAPQCAGWILTETALAVLVGKIQ